MSRLFSVFNFAVGDRRGFALWNGRGAGRGKRDLAKFLEGVRRTSSLDSRHHRNLLVGAEVATRLLINGLERV